MAVLVKLALFIFSAYINSTLLSGPDASGLEGSTSSREGWYHCSVTSLSTGDTIGLSTGLVGFLELPGGTGGLPEKKKCQLVNNVLYARKLQLDLYDQCFLNINTPTFTL